MGITRRRQRGQVLIVFPIAAIAILGVIGLLYSFGLILDGRRTLQTAADAASLSGSWHVLQELASGTQSDAAIQTTVADFATRVNGASSDALEAVYVDAAGVALTSDGLAASVAPNCPMLVGSGGTFPTQARGVQVTVTRQVATILPAFANIVQTRVRATATAASRASTFVVLMQDAINQCAIL